MILKLMTTFIDLQSASHSLFTSQIECLKRLVDHGAEVMELKYKISSIWPFLGAAEDVDDFEVDDNLLPVLKVTTYSTVVERKQQEQESAKLIQRILEADLVLMITTTAQFIQKRPPVATTQQETIISTYHSKLISRDTR